MAPPCKGAGRFASARGFTIVEVIAATFVLAFGIASALAAIAGSIRITDQARSITLCSQILQSELERIRLLNWGQVTALPAEATVAIPEAVGITANAVARFTLIRQVSTPIDKPADMRDLRLIVRWTSTSGTAHERTFLTRYGRNGLYDYYYTIAR